MIRFKNKLLEEQFHRDGVVAFPLLNEKEVAELRQFYFSKKSKHGLQQEQYHTTTDTENVELINEVDARLKSVLIPKVDAVLEDYESLLATFIVKEPGPNSKTPYHQDPTFVEEEKYASANIWVPLQDTTPDNGNLRVVKGSHRVINSLRVTPSFPYYFSDYYHMLDEYAEDIPLKAGTAVLLSHATIHGAPINNSSAERLAAVMAVKSGGDWIFHYHEPGTSNDRIEKYKLSVESFRLMKRNSRPEKAEFLQYLSYEFPKVSKEKFEASLPSFKKNRSFFSKILSGFKRNNFLKVP